MSNSNPTTKQAVSDGGRGGIKFGAYDDDDPSSAYLTPAATAGGGSDGGDEMVTSLPTLEEERRLYADDDEDAYNEEEDEGRIAGTSSSSRNYHRQAEDTSMDTNIDPFASHSATNGSGIVNTRISDRESSYHARKHDREL
ncbi:hypothetical protein ACHAXH_000008, partial [Discostella pseudostelligera]